MKNNQILYTFKRIPELDGLRGIAVLGVLFFHLDLLPGGYLGVDLFFVLSGFLITSLLIHEHYALGYIRLKEFWLNRARRLLPALLLFLVVVGAITVKFADANDFLRWRNDTIGTLAYVVNWRYVFAEHDYWALFSSPSPLTHMWSLAIEEQFYLFWPLLITFGLSKFKQPMKGLINVALFGALLSALWFITIYLLNNEATSRVYLGTDTRIAAILFGAVVSLYIFNCEKNKIKGVVLPPFLIGILVGLLCVSWIFLEGTNPTLYQGGLLFCSVSAALIILVIAQQQASWLQVLLRFSPLMWIGTISYGLYLWHFPIYIVVDEIFPALSELMSISVKLVITLLCAIVSYYVFEMPIRKKRWPLRFNILLLLLSLVSILALCIYATLNAVTLPKKGLYSTYQFDSNISQNKLRILVVGDSMATMLGEALSDSVNLENNEIIGVSGCGVLGDVKVKTSKGNVFSNTQCDKTESRWKESLARFQPEAIILMYGGPVGAQRLIDGNWSRPCNIDFDNRYTQELVNIVDLFSHSDALIFFPTIAYSTIGDSNTVATHKEMDCINETFRNVAAANERVGMIELASFVCPSNYCRKELNGVQLRADGLHYSDEGGRLILQWLNNQVRGHPLISKGSR